MKQSKMNLKKLFQMVGTGEGKWMTLEDAKALKGKTIYWSYIGSQAKVVYETKVGEIIIEWDYALTQECEGYANRQEYWAKVFADRQDLIEDFKNTLLLLDANGDFTGIKCYLNNPYFNVPTMTCSDMDRGVFYTETYYECDCLYIKTDKGLYNVAEPWNKIDEETGEVIPKYNYYRNDRGIMRFEPNPEFERSTCRTFNDMITGGSGIYVNDLDLASIVDVRDPKKARAIALELGYDIPLDVFESNYKAWKAGEHSQRVVGDYVVYSPDNRKTFGYYISKYVGLSTQVDIERI